MRLRAALLVCALAVPAFGAAPFLALAEAPARPVYKDPSAPVEKRVEDLLARMTLEEKVAQLLSLWESKAEIFDAEGKLDPAKMAAKFPDGLGQFTRPSDISSPGSPHVQRPHDIPQTAELVKSQQKYALTRTRLGIPILFHEEGLHG